MVREIKLTQGFTAMVDDEDFALVTQHCWFPRRHRNTYYAIAQPRVEGRQRRVRMHRLILSAPARFLVDHRNGNGLDNCRSNLRLATNAQNQANQHAVRGLSRFKGVTWDSRDRVWVARIRLNGKRVRLGAFVDEEEAAVVYDNAARIFKGEFAKTNF